MRKFLCLLLCGLLICCLSGCSLKARVQQGVYDVLDDLTGMQIIPSEGGSSHLPGKGDHTLAPLPEGSSYRERLEHEWQNTPNEGYVWTITIDDVDILDIMGLCTASYNVNLSASHIGPDMYGPYFGSFGFDYEADLSGMEALFTYQGGSMEYDTDGWFQNDQYVFALSSYEAEEEEMLKAVVQAGSEYEGMSAEEQAMLDGLLGDILGGESFESFEQQDTPVAMWWDYDMPMTEGDMSGYLQMNGVLGGILDAGSEVDETGTYAVANARTAFGLYAEGQLIMTFDERYSTQETFQNPMPHTIKVYPGGQVVMTFYSATGSPYVTKCYGTIDKIPVEDTVLPNQ